MKKRIGNDIQFTWHIYRKSGETQTPESFDGKDVEVKLMSPLKQPVTIEDVSIATGVVTFTFRGKHQVTLGNYVAVLLENKGEDGMVTLDVVNAVTLVPHSYMEEDGDDGDVIEATSVELDSEIGQGIDAYTKAETDNLFLRKRVTQGGQYAERGLVTSMVNTIDGVGVLSTNAYAGGIIIGHNTNTLTLSPDAIIKVAGYTSPVSVVWADTATQQIPAATTSAPGLMSAEDKQKITDIEAVIPEQASPNNKLVDKDFVNSSVATATATYRGSYNLVSALLLSVSATQQQIAAALATKMNALSITPDNNDYCFVQIPTADATPTEIARIDRYKYDGTAWAYEYSLNNSSFTAAQWAALNSGITSGLVAKLFALPTNSELEILLNGKASTKDANIFAKKNTFPDIALSEEYALDYSECNIGDTLTTAYGEVLTFKNNNTNNSVQLYNNVKNFAINLVDIEGLSNCIEIEVPSAGELRFTSNSTAKLMQWMRTADRTSVFVIENNGEIIFYQDCRPSAAASDAAIGKIINLMKGSIPVNVQAGTVKIYFSALYERVAALGYLWYISNVSFSSTISSVKQAVNAKANTADLAPVATSGSYNDLSGKPDLSVFITNSVDNLVNYYLKSDTYTKTEVQQLIGALQMFHYEIYSELPQSGAGNVLYLIGPTGSGSDKYEEYVYANDAFTKIGDTSIDLSGYVTTSALNTTLRDYVTSATLTVLLADKADKSEMSVVPGTGADADKTTITLKQGTSATVLTAHQDISGKENVMPITTATGATLTAVVGNYYRLDNVGTLTITLPTITGATKLQAITFLIVCSSSALVTFAPQDSETILYQEDFALEADTTYEVTALWNGSEWTLSRVIYE